MTDVLCVLQLALWLVVLVRATPLIEVAPTTQEVVEFASTVSKPSCTLYSPLLHPRRPHGIARFHRFESHE